MKDKRFTLKFLGAFMESVKHQTGRVPQEPVACRARHWRPGSDREVARANHRNWGDFQMTPRAANIAGILISLGITAFLILSGVALVLAAR